MLSTIVLVLLLLSFPSSADTSNFGYLPSVEAEYGHLYRRTRGDAAHGTGNMATGWERCRAEANTAPLRGRSHCLANFTGYKPPLVNAGNADGASLAAPLSYEDPVQKRPARRGHGRRHRTNRTAEHSEESGQLDQQRQRRLRGALAHATAGAPLRVAVLMRGEAFRSNRGEARRGDGLTARRAATCVPSALPRQAAILEQHLALFGLLRTLHGRRVDLFGVARPCTAARALSPAAPTVAPDGSGASAHPSSALDGPRLLSFW